MDAKWDKLASRIVRGLNVQPGELIDVRDDTGCLDMLLATSLAVERAGATPLQRLLPAEYLERLWTDAPGDYLAEWDRHRQKLMMQVDRIVVLGGAKPDPAGVSPDVLDAWGNAQYRLSLIEEERRLPYLVVAFPTERRATQLGMTNSELEQVLLPALEAGIEELQREITRVLGRVASGGSITIRTGDGHALQMEHGNRAWLSDDGYIDEADRAQGAIVSNLPAGSIYTTVVEDETRGSLWLSQAGEASDVVLHFSAGRIVDVEAASGAELLTAMLDRHTGEARRVSHIGLGLNRFLKRPIGWTIVDEHVQGHLFIALGENRYMGGQNESSLNVDYALSDATMEVDGQSIVENGNVVL